MPTRRKSYTPEDRAKAAGFTTEYKENTVFLLLFSDKRYARLDEGKKLIDEADVLFDQLKRQLTPDNIESFQAKRLEAIHMGQEAQDRRGYWPQFVYVYFLNPKLFVQVAQQAYDHIAKLAESLSPPTTEDVAAAEALERRRYPPPPDPRILDIVDPSGRPYRLGEYIPAQSILNAAPTAIMGPVPDSEVFTLSAPQAQPLPPPSNGLGASWRAWDDIPNDMPTFRMEDDTRGQTSRSPHISFTFGQILHSGTPVHCAARRDG